LFVKVDPKGQVMDEHITIQVRGFSLGVRNSTKSLYMEGTVANLKWLVSELMADMLAKHGGDPSNAAGGAARLTEAVAADTEDPEEEDHREKVNELLKNQYNG
jgi:hypothetical protein